MRLALLTLLLLAVTAAPAAAQATTTATPDRAGKGTRLHTELDATEPPLSGRIPEETVLSVQPGFRFDGRAVAKRCTAEQGREDACPARSGFGSAVVVATYGGSDYTVPIDLYLARPFQAGDVAGFVAVAKALGSTYSATGRITRPAAGGLSVVLTSPVPDAASFGVTVKSITADVGASRKVRKGKRRIRRHLLTNPRTCDGTWDASAAFTFSDGSTATLETPIACTP